MAPRVRAGLSLLLVALIGTVACGGDDAGHAGDGSAGGSVLVFAAASLTDAFADVEAAFEAAHPGTDVQLNLAGSSSLREQILAGAPADVFASANANNMDAVVEAGAIDGEPRVFVRNALQIAVPAGNPGGVTGLESLADDDLLVGLCAEGVPCGDLARDALDQAGVEASLDTNEPDVRALLTKIAVGELDAGIVYATDVLVADGDVEAVDLPPAVDVRATYPIAVLGRTPHPGPAEDFVEFVLSEAGQEILAAHGFEPA